MDRKDKPSYSLCRLQHVYKQMQAESTEKTELETQRAPILTIVSGKMFGKWRKEH